MRSILRPVSHAIHVLHSAPPMTRSVCFLFPPRLKYLLLQKRPTTNAASNPNLNIMEKVAINHGRPKALAKFEASYEMGNAALSGLPEKRPFRVLGIDTSCDDTGVAVVSSDGKLLSNVVYSQYKLHSEYGGVVPGIARDAHKANLESCIEYALQQAQIPSMEHIDAIAATIGPGLDMCLRVGASKARSLALQYSKPFVNVHHIEGHCLITRLQGIELMQSTSYDTQQPITEVESSQEDRNTFQPHVAFPFLALVASGGHTQIMIVEGVGSYRVLGGTVDDAMGECFDKAARLIGLTHTNTSGGSAVEKAAALGRKDRYPLPVPMYKRKHCDFSFAGLKNALRMAIKEVKAISVHRVLSKVEITNGKTNEFDEIQLPLEEQYNFAATLQHAAFTSVEDRIERAMEICVKEQLPIDALVVVGGVAANMQLRSRLQELIQRWKQSHNAKWRLVFPPQSLCTDNGAMIAWAGVEKLLLGVSDNPSVDDVHPRWILGTEFESLSQHEEAS